MKTFLSGVILAFLLSGHYSQGQVITQTIRGTLMDEDGKFPLQGATVVISGTNPVRGTTTNTSGEFRLDKVPVGRIDLEIKFIGYEDLIIPNIPVNSGKEIVLDLEIRESFVKVDEVVVTAGKNKGEVLNEMAITSSRSFSVDETKRYAGAFQDPSRMVSAFAGVTSDPEGDNDIVVRGNSPKGILWLLEGIEIPNPNHFADEGSTGGPINAINSELLSNSDFYTGAFAPEYGDALSGVFDMHMRSGNNEKHEYSVGVGVMGTDVMLEGPFSKNYNGSYLVNYRYSSLAMLNEAGLVDYDGVPKYQDLGFKFMLPSDHYGTLSIFGLGGKSGISQREEDNKGALVGEGAYHAKLGVVGLNYTLSFNPYTLMKITLSASGNGSHYNWEELDSLEQMQLNSQGDWEKASLRSAIMFSSKINQRNRIVAGIKFTRHFYNMYEHYLDEDFGRWVYRINMNMDADNWQGYISWKWRLTDDLTVVSGLHGIYFSLNNDFNLELRVGLKWQIDPKQTFSLGYGSHSKIESIYAYYMIKNLPDGKSFAPNTNLGLSKARHYVLGYEYRFTKNLNSKIELYYQDLYNIPVENNDTSVFSMLNSDDGYIDEILVNDGKGYNYGLELTLERYFANQYYFLLTSSFYNSKYKTREDIWRNTKYNGNYSINFLAGKEFNIGKERGKKILGINGKLYYNGGLRYIPVKLEESRQEGESVYDDSKAWDKRLDDIFQMNLCITFRINRSKAGHEFILDIYNLTNAQGRTWEYYNEYNDMIDYDRQFNIMPNIMYRIHF
jgi:hypothetical protein